MDFAGLYEQCWKDIVRYIQYKFPTLSREDAEDVAQESFIIAWQQLDSYNPAKGAVMGWLCNFAYWNGLTAVRASNGRIYVEYDTILDDRSVPDVSNIVEARELLVWVEGRMRQGTDTLVQFAIELDYSNATRIRATVPVAIRKRVAYYRRALRQEL